MRVITAVKEGVKNLHPKMNLCCKRMKINATSTISGRIHDPYFGMHLLNYIMQNKNNHRGDKSLLIQTVFYLV